MSLQMDTVIGRANGLTAAPVGDDMVILNMANNNYIGLDPIGRRIWALLETPWRIDDLCRRLSDEFDGPAEDIAKDVVSFLIELESEGLAHVEKG